MKIKIFFVSVIMIFLGILLYEYYLLQNPDQTSSPGFSKEGLSVPINYSLDKYSIVEKTETQCTENSDCTLPNNYAIRSSCPYKSVCMQNTCTVICPEQK